jgi:hypothetical protein
MNKKILAALFTSFIGNHFYILFVTLILLKLGYGVGFVSFAIGATIIPNLLFGPALGRLVDRSNKTKLHTILCISLALVVNAIGLVAFNVDQEIGQVLIFVLMIIYNVFTSPLNTILYQYIVPSLDESESKAFIIWERYEAMGIFLASVLGYLMLKNNIHHLLLVVDGVTFLLCGLVIHNAWSTDIVSEDEEVSAKYKLSELVIANMDKKKMLLGILSALVFVFAVDSHTYNIGALFFKEHGIEDVFIPLIMSGISLFNIAGSIFFEKKLLNTCEEKVHKNVMKIVSILLVVMATGVITKNAWISLLGLVLLQIIEPIWSTTNNILIRSQVKPERMGEFFGSFRIVRSIFTFAGITIYGFSQEQNYLGIFIALSSMMTLLPVLASYVYGKLKNVQVLEEEVVV